MTSIADDVRDAIHDELMGVAAALTRPASDASTKNAPDPVMISQLITQILLPILTSVVSGILTHLATRGDSDATERKLADIDSQLKALVHRDEPEDAAILDAIVHTLAVLPAGAAKIGAVPEPEVAKKVAAELERYHLSGATSARLAPIIIKRTLAALSSGTPSEA
jgi:hypothetical protein